MLRCPTGALHYTRLDGGPPEPDAAGEATVTVTADGPLYVQGAVEVVNERGEPLLAGTRLALCRCGKTLHPPLCDGSHRAAGFRG